MGDNHIATGAKVPDDNAATAATHAFIQCWNGTSACTLAAAQSFMMDLCQLPGVDKPHV